MDPLLSSLICVNVKCHDWSRIARKHFKLEKISKQSWSSIYKLANICSMVNSTPLARDIPGPSRSDLNNRNTLTTIWCTLLVFLFSWFICVALSQLKQGQRSEKDGGYDACVVDCEINVTMSYFWRGHTSWGVTLQDVFSQSISLDAIGLMKKITYSRIIYVFYQLVCMLCCAY